MAFLKQNAWISHIIWLYALARQNFRREWPTSLETFWNVFSQVLLAKSWTFCPKNLKNFSHWGGCSPPCPQLVRLRDCGKSGGLMGITLDSRLSGQGLSTGWILGHLKTPNSDSASIYPEVQVIISKQMLDVTLQQPLFPLGVKGKYSQLHHATKSGY